MSDWDVHLVFSKGSSNKFWRARTDDCRMFVNYGRVGTNGQTQVKDFPTPEKAQAEMGKVAGSKRRKGYSDQEGDAPGGEEAAAEAPAARPTAKKAEKPRVADLELSADKRSIELRLELQGRQLRTVVVEHYDSAKSAGEAFERISEAMAEEGYSKVSARKEL